MTQSDMVAPTSVAELVREIAQALVDDPAAVEVQSVDRDENTVLKLRVAPQDVGKVIGKQGRTARSVRTILGAVSMKLPSSRSSVNACVPWPVVSTSIVLGPYTQ